MLHPPYMNNPDEAIATADLGHQVPWSAVVTPGTPGPSEKRQLAINASSNVVVMAAKIALVFVVSPILVHKLGDARYGAWMFVNAISALPASGRFRREERGHALRGAVRRFERPAGHQSRLQHVLGPPARPSARRSWASPWPPATSGDCR